MVDAFEMGTCFDFCEGVLDRSPYSHTHATHVQKTAPGELAGTSVAVNDHLETLAFEIGIPQSTTVTPTPSCRMTMTLMTHSMPHSSVR